MNKHRWLNLLLIDNSKLPLFTKRFLCPLGRMDNKFKHMSISGDCSEIAPGEGYLFPSPCRRSNRHCCYRKIHNDTMTQRWPIRRDGCGRGGSALVDRQLAGITLRVIKFYWRLLLDGRCITQHLSSHHWQSSCSMWIRFERDWQQWAVKLFCSSWFRWFWHTSIFYWWKLEACEITVKVNIIKPEQF